MHTVHRSTLPVYVDSKAKFPHFSLPMLVGYFSLNSERQFHADTSQLRYIYFPRRNENLAWDLNVGLENVERADESKQNERIDQLLRGILASGISIKPEVAGFVCFRGLLTTIMTTPYEQSQGWEILVSKFKGILYLCAHETDEKRKQRMAEDERQKRFSSWGFKFEQYLMSETPNQEPDVHKPVKEGEEFCCIFRTKLNNHRLLFGAEMDGVRSKEPIQNSLTDLGQAEFVELKTSRRFDSMRQERNFKRYKLLKWWAQSFLVGIKNIVCGFRDDNGVVDSIKFYPLQEIPKITKDMWVPAVCMTFLDQFLSFVETTINHSSDKNDPHSVWRFRWEPGVQFVTVDEFLGQSSFTFLPEWYLSATNTVDHHPLQSFTSTPSTLHQSTGPPAESSFANSCTDPSTGTHQGPNRLQNPSDSISPTSVLSSPTVDHISPQEFIDSSYDPFFNNSFLAPTASASDAVHQSLSTTSPEMSSFIPNTSSSLHSFLPSTGVNSASKNFSSYSYSTTTTENVPDLNHGSNSSFSFIPLSTTTMNSLLPLSSDNTSLTSVPTSSSLIPSNDPLHQFMSSNSTVEILSCPTFLQADKLP